MILKKGTSAEPRNLRLASRCMEREGHLIGLGVSNVITVFAPGRIALGDGVMKDSSLLAARLTHGCGLGADSCR